MAAAIFAFYGDTVTLFQRACVVEGEVFQQGLKVRIPKGRLCYGV